MGKCDKSKLPEGMCCNESGLACTRISLTQEEWVSCPCMDGFTEEVVIKAEKLKDRFIGEGMLSPVFVITRHGKEYVTKLALVAAEEVRSAIPMYTGELNPKWKFWDDVVKYLSN